MDYIIYRVRHNGKVKHFDCYYEAVRYCCKHADADMLPEETLASRMKHAKEKYSMWGLALFCYSAGALLVIFALLLSRSWGGV